LEVIAGREERGRRGKSGDRSPAPSAGDPPPEPQDHPSACGTKLATDFGGGEHWLLVPQDSTAQDRLNEATTVFHEIMGTREKGIPEELLGKAHCIVIIPGMKSGAIGIGGKYGRGYAMCRNKSGVGWGAPAAMRVEGGSFGFQIGGQSTDVVMLVMNDRGMEHLLKSKFTLGGDASVAAGPVGREATAKTDATMRAEILSWSRARGIFAGVSLQGATLRNE